MNPVALPDTAQILSAKAQSHMPIGIGWRHPHYREMLERHPALDFLEVHSENFFAQGGARLAVLEQGRATYPISLHGMGLGLGSAVGLDDWHLDQLERLVQRIDPVRISDHACFARGGHAGQTVHAIDLLPVPFTNGALNVMCANVQRVQDRLKRPIVVENLAAYLSWKPDEADPPQAEPAFLSALARRTGCALLVDVNNLYVNALNAQASDPVKECLRWIDAIPGSCVGELHVGGHSTRSDSHGEIVMDDHASPVSEAVWRIFRHAVHSFGAVPTLVEWDTRIPAMDILLNEAQIARSSAAAILALAT